jgi:hypothetical protein
VRTYSTHLLIKEIIKMIGIDKLNYQTLSKLQKELNELCMENQRFSSFSFQTFLESTGETNYYFFFFSL